MLRHGTRKTCTQLCCVLVDVGCTSVRSNIDRLLLRLDVDKAGGRRWTGLARGGGTEVVRVAASDAAITAMAAHQTALLSRVPTYLYPSADS